MLKRLRLSVGESLTDLIVIAQPTEKVPLCCGLPRRLSPTSRAEGQASPASPSCLVPKHERRNPAPISQDISRQFNLRIPPRSVSSLANRASRALVTILVSKVWPPRIAGDRKST